MVFLRFENRITLGTLLVHSDLVIKTGHSPFVQSMVHGLHTRITYTMIRPS